MVSAADIAALLTQLQQQMETLKSLIKDIVPSKNSFTDSRGIGRPIAFKGEETKWIEWKAKLVAFLHSTMPECNAWLAWAMTRSEKIEEIDLGERLTEKSVQVHEFSVKLYSVLLSGTE